MIPSSVTEIEEEAFIECKRLERIEFQSSEIELDYCNFDSVTLHALKSIVVPKGKVLYYKEALHGGHEANRVVEKQD